MSSQAFEVEDSVIGFRRDECSQLTREVERIDVTRNNTKQTHPASELETVWPMSPRFLLVSPVQHVTRRGFRRPSCRVCSRELGRISRYYLSRLGRTLRFVKYQIPVPCDLKLLGCSSGIPARLHRRFPLTGVARHEREAEIRANFIPRHVDSVDEEETK